ncbi:MAG: glycosyltransferase [Planctomycetes bacterium]|nr:glycosyltransferase [Planctomycetota bacterium]
MTRCLRDDRPGAREADALAWPRLSIVIPSFNQGGFLGEALDSLLGQDYPCLEILVMDGGSTDGTVEVLKAYEPHLAFWHSGPDAGQSDAINRGFEKSTGEVLNWLCCDDLLTPGALRRVGGYFRDHPECQWLAGAAETFYIEQDRRAVNAPGAAHRRAFQEFWLWGAPGHVIYQPACFWRRDLWQRGGRLRVDNHLAMDYELWLEFSRLAELHVIEEVLAVSRVHSRCKSGGQRYEQVRQTMRSAYADAARDGVAAPIFTLRLLGGLRRYRAARLRRAAAERWTGGVCRELAAMACDLGRIWTERGRLGALRYMIG